MSPDFKFVQDWHLEFFRGVALDLWRRVPKHRRRQLRAGARRHGSRLAGAAGAFAARSAKQAKARVVESASSRG